MPDTTAQPTGPLVLYVDDERGNRVVFEQSLAPEFNIQTVADGPAALEVLEHRNDVAVVVTDMRMPKMSGEDLLRIVKEKYPRTVRIVLTAYSDIDPILRAINEGLVARYIIKPWQRAEVVQVLRWGVEAWNFGKDAVELQRRLIETERLATIGRFASMFVHDLRTPLSSALLNLGMIGDQIVPQLRDAIADADTDLEPSLGDQLTSIVDELERSHHQIDQALATLKDFLSAMNAFAKGTRQAGPVETDPLPIVRHAMSVCQSLALKLHAQIDYRGPNQLPHVRMSPTELTQVLINVLANGAQAVAARGLANGYVSIEAHPHGHELELRVHDEGVGMPPEVLSRVGTPFFTTRSEGTGLGIAQCQRLIGTAGGRLQIESEPGVGTTVTIILPTAA
ncbi:MAG: sensor histidine kinase [Acidobacteriota bacterium]